MKTVTVEKGHHAAPESLAVVVRDGSGLVSIVAHIHPATICAEHEIDPEILANEIQEAISQWINTGYFKGGE